MLNFNSHLLPEALLYFDFGFMLFEKIYDVSDHPDHKGLYYFSKLKSRLPDSVQRWITHPDWEEPGVEQYGYRHDKWINAKIPGWKLFRLTMDQEGDNYQGISMLRSAYKPWHFKSALEKIGAIAAERNTVGIPTLKRTEANAGASTGTNEKNQNADILKNVRAGKSAYLDLPFGLDFEFSKVFWARGGVLKHVVVTTRCRLLPFLLIVFEPYGIITTVRRVNNSQIKVVVWVSAHQGHIVFVRDLHQYRSSEYSSGGIT